MFNIHNKITLNIKLVNDSKDFLSMIPNFNLYCISQNSSEKQNQQGIYNPHSVIFIFK